MVERKAFLANPKCQYRISQCGEHDCLANNKKMEIVMSIQVCLVSWMNFDYEENGGKKVLLANPKHHDHVSQYGEHDCRANNKKNEDFYEYPSLSHFMDELCL